MNEIPKEIRLRRADGSECAERPWQWGRDVDERILVFGGTYLCDALKKLGFQVLHMGPGAHQGLVLEHPVTAARLWQLLAARKGIAIKVIPMNDKGELLLDEYEKLFSERTKIVSVVQVSNVLGTVNPVKEMIATAHAHGVPFIVDAAQSIPHMKVDVQDLDADFLVFSAHKIYGPTGVGVLYGKEEWLDRLPPYQGGEMIQHVSFEKTTFNELPFKFEAGTPDYIGTTGLAKALDYVNGIGLDRIAAHEHELTTYALKRLKEIPHMRIFGEAADRGAVISFLVGDIHHFDLGTLLDRLGIAVRTGHHCAQPLMQRLGIEGTVRASFAMYNTKAEVDVLVAGIERVSRMF